MSISLFPSVCVLVKFSLCCFASSYLQLFVSLIFKISSSVLISMLLPFFFSPLKEKSQC
uniref:Uncharacterized protein n=1 Tax=Rhizophora mucronata TaxID=61149 RepID=A0A2P2PEG8_RHIMU